MASGTTLDPVLRIQVWSPTMNPLLFTNYSGPLLALASAALFGASTPVAKLLLGVTDPLLLAGLLYLGSGIGLGIIGLGTRLFSKSVEAPLRRRDFPWLGMIVLFGGVLGPALLMTGLTSASGGAGSLLLNTESLATMAIAWLFFRENVDRRVFAGAMAILAGALVLSWPADGAAMPVGWSGALIVAACICWGIDNNLTRKLSAADPVQIAMVKGIAAGVINTALGFAHGAQLPKEGTFAAAAVVGFLGYGVSLVLFVLGLRHLGAARTGAYFSTAPFIGAAIAVPLLGEPITWPLIAAAALMAVGVYLHLAEAHDHEHLHAPLEHEHRHVHDIHHQHEHAPDAPAGEPHSHWHRHSRVLHKHPHYPDLHHRHRHEHA
jgi:drug/metabolite transporter (DMT)-like permease